MKHRAIMLLLLASLAGSVFAYVIGGTNLSFLGYPDHSCRKPNKPIKPYSFDNRSEVDTYNGQVDSYNFELQRYITCVKEYLENAGNDIKRIEEKMDGAVAEAKRLSY
jgi:hypothetical protein